jgi:uroporphyrin-III C-methyltransferase
MSGKVYLMGAGPGDPELLTLKSHRTLGEADVVLHDDLVNPEILRLARPSARVVNVGKRCGNKTTTQERIHCLITAYAGAGLTVVRLKGGDPLIFGRAGEEMEALRRAGIEFEVIPGVTAASAAAAAARIALTDRRVASKVVFLSNHRCNGKARADFGAIDCDVTVVVYMPGGDYRSLTERLRAAGLGPETPCLIVSRVTYAQEQVHLATLATLPDAPRLPAPALIIVGDVARGYSQAEGVAARTGERRNTLNWCAAPSGFARSLL